MDTDIALLAVFVCAAYGDAVWWRREHGRDGHRHRWDRGGRIGDGTVAYRERSTRGHRGFEVTG